jgi:hypothetical protein
MGFLKDFAKGAVKIVAAPLYVPLKVAEELEKPPQYNWWYHDGRGESDDSARSEYEQAASFEE